MHTVLVTGASGYIGRHTIKYLITKGYIVIAQVRSSSKGDALKEQFQEHLEYVVVADITATGAFDKVIQNNQSISSVIHLASPFTPHFDDLNDDIIEPAYHGTKNILESIKEFGPKIRRFVHMSSMAAVLMLDAPKDLNVTTETWLDISKEDAVKSYPTAYCYSKYIAEKTAWDFVKNNKVHFTLNVVNPYFVLGPQPFDTDVNHSINFSNTIIDDLLNLKPSDQIPSMLGASIDIRDVIKTIAVALESDESDQRLFVSNENYSSQLILDLINKNFPHLNLPKGDAGNYSSMENLPTILCLETENLTGNFISLETSVVDTVNQILNSNN